MFFKKSQSDNTEDEAVAKRGIKKMDAIVTGAILGGVVASLYGVKKLKEKKDKEHEIEEQQTEKALEKKGGIFSFFQK